MCMMLNVITSLYMMSILISWIHFITNDRCYESVVSQIDWSAYNKAVSL